MEPRDIEMNNNLVISGICQIIMHQMKSFHQSYGCPVVEWLCLLMKSGAEAKAGSQTAVESTDPFSVWLTNHCKCLVLTKKEIWPCNHFACSCQ